MLEYMCIIGQVRYEMVWNLWSGSLISDRDGDTKGKSE